MILKTKLHERISTEIVKNIGIWEGDGMRLAYLASQVPDNGVIVEIGSYRGRSAAYMAAALKPDSNIKIFCIDLWANANQEKFVSTANDLEMLKNYLVSLDLYKFITTIRSDSIEASKDWKLPIDLLFIDGNHSYEGVSGDYQAWYPHVKRGGVIAFHDYHEINWQGVRTFVDETASKQIKFLGLHERTWSGEKL